MARGKIRVGWIMRNILLRITLKSWAFPIQSLGPGPTSLALPPSPSAK